MSLYILLLCHPYVSHSVDFCIDIFIWEVTTQPVGMPSRVLQFICICYYSWVHSSYLLFAAWHLLILILPEDISIRPRSGELRMYYACLCISVHSDMSVTQLGHARYFQENKE